MLTPVVAQQGEGASRHADQREQPSGITEKQRRLCGRGAIVSAGAGGQRAGLGAGASPHAGEREQSSLVPAKQSARFEYPTHSVIVLQRLSSGGGQLSTKEYGVVVVIYPACIVSTFFLKSLGQQRRARPHAVTSWRKMAAHWRAAIQIDCRWS